MLKKACIFIALHSVMFFSLSFCVLVDILDIFLGMNDNCLFFSFAVFLICNRYVTVVNSTLRTGVQLASPIAQADASV